MKQLFKLVSIGWIISPFVYAGLRIMDKLHLITFNVEKQNVTIFLVLCGISYVAMFLNSDTK